MTSSSTSKIKALVSVVLLIPGLALSVFKLLAYVFTDMRGRHNLAKEHFTPINREIGSAAHPIANFDALRDALTAERNQPKHQPTNALIIHGDGNLKINTDPGILPLNPMKLILEGARIVHEPSCYRLDDRMRKTGKWQIAATPVVPAADADLKNPQVSSVQQAIAFTAPRRDWTSCKRYHTVFMLARPQ